MTLTSETIKLSFSGHDSFHCRQLWLKKGYDFVKSGKHFSSEDAVVKLGVGKNMVSAIRYWLKAFCIIDNKDVPTEFGVRLLDDDKGYDPFLEDEASLWLLHYHLVKSGHASIFSIVFNEFRKEKIYFDQKSFVNYIKRIGDSVVDININENTINKDFTVFSNLYKNDTSSKNIEDSFSGIMAELDLLQSREKQLFIENKERDSLPHAVILYAILDNETYGNSISLSALESNINSPGSIFALNRNGLLNKISEIVSNNEYITYTDQAGIKELQFKNKPNVFTVIDKYYGK
jgi:hypothetical protein